MRWIGIYFFLEYLEQQHPDPTVDSDVVGKLTHTKSCCLNFSNNVFYSIYFCSTIFALDTCAHTNTHKKTYSYFIFRCPVRYFRYKNACAIGSHESISISEGTRIELILFYIFFYRSFETTHNNPQHVPVRCIHPFCRSIDSGTYFHSKFICCNISNLFIHFIKIAVCICARCVWSNGWSANSSTNRWLATLGPQQSQTDTAAQSTTTIGTVAATKQCTAQFVRFTRLSRPEIIGWHCRGPTECRIRESIATQSSYPITGARVNSHRWQISNETGART